MYREKLNALFYRMTGVLAIALVSTRAGAKSQFADPVSPRPILRARTNATRGIKTPARGSAYLTLLRAHRSAQAFAQ